MLKKIKTSDRYVVEDGIPTIRPIHPGTGMPMCTEKEFAVAAGNLQRLLDARQRMSGPMTPLEPDATLGEALSIRNEEP